MHSGTDLTAYGLEARDSEFGHVEDFLVDGWSWRPDEAIDRDWEGRLHAHYGRPGYWERPEDRYLLWSRAA